jgi:hypothetical protein
MVMRADHNTQASEPRHITSACPTQSTHTLWLPVKGPLLLVGDCCPRVSPLLEALPVDVESDRHLTTNVPSRLEKGEGGAQADSKWQQVCFGFTPLTSEETSRPLQTMLLCLVHQRGHGYQGASVLVAARGAHRPHASTAGSRRPASLLL